MRDYFTVTKSIALDTFVIFHSVTRVHVLNMVEIINAYADFVIICRNLCIHWQFLCSW
jgi:hypothetical protein